MTITLTISYWLIPIIFNILGISFLTWQYKKQQTPGNYVASILFWAFVGLAMFIPWGIYGMVAAFYL